MANIEKNEKRFDLFKKNQNQVRKIIKILAKIPFLSHENNNLVKDGFEYINNSLKEQNNDNINTKDYEEYYRNAWIKYLEKDL